MNRPTSAFTRRLARPRPWPWTRVPHPLVMLAFGKSGGGDPEVNASREAGRRVGQRSRCGVAALFAVGNVVAADGVRTMNGHAGGEGEALVMTPRSSPQSDDLRACN